MGIIARTVGQGSQLAGRNLPFGLLLPEIRESTLEEEEESSQPFYEHGRPQAHLILAEPVALSLHFSSFLFTPGPRLVGQEETDPSVAALLLAPALARKPGNAEALDRLASQRELQEHRYPARQRRRVGATEHGAGTPAACSLRGWHLYGPDRPSLNEAAGQSLVGTMAIQSSGGARVTPRRPPFNLRLFVEQGGSPSASSSLRGWHLYGAP
jgi:hypothetical protein